MALRITEEEFNELYPDLKGRYSFFNEPPPKNISKREFEQKYLKSKLWRLNNCYTVIGKHGKPVKFVMNKAQHKVYAASRKHPRIIILKSRQQGISTFWLVSFNDDALFCPYLSIGLMAQGTDEAATLLERTKLLWDKLNPRIKHFLNISLVKDNMKEFSYSNTSKIFIRVSFRSATLQRLHISELGKIANNYPKRARETKTGTLQALAQGMTGIVESTAEGRNMFKNMWEEAEITKAAGNISKKDFYPVFLSWIDDPDCVVLEEQPISAEAAKYFAKIEKELEVKLSREQKNFWIAQERELKEGVYQEYPATPEEAFRATRDGTYFAKDFNRFVLDRQRIINGLYDPSLPVDIYFDLGVDDYFVLVAVQWDGRNYNIIREHFENGMGIEYYLKLAKDWEFSHLVENLYFPHDARRRELGKSDLTGEARQLIDSIEEYVDDMRWNVRCEVLERVDLLDGIEWTRKLLKNMRIDSSCDYIMDCLLNYSKEWDDRRECWKTIPDHNEFSHGADTIRQIAIHHNLSSPNLYEDEEDYGGYESYAV